MSNPEQLQTIIPILAAGVLVLALLLMLGSLRLFRKSRKDIYWRQRRMAGQRGWRLFLWSMGLVLVAGVLFAATAVAGFLYGRGAKTPTAIANAASPLDVPTLTATVSIPSPAPSATASTTPLPSTVTATSTVLPSTAIPTPIPTTSPTMQLTATATLTPIPPTDVPTVILTATPTGSITLTTVDTPLVVSDAANNADILTVTLTDAPTNVAPAATIATDILAQTPTLTSTTTLTSVPSATLTLTPTSSATALGGVTPLESSVTPSADARITITALDTQISGDFGPVKAATAFSAGFTRIYYFVNFTGMQNGVLWRRELLLDNQVIQSNQYLWGLTQSGAAYFFFGQEDGFKPGSYRINLFIGSSTQPTGTIAFTVS